ncbi:MAG: DUF389 domain-containing protein [Gammaproteobacteria bacterium]|nr:DUF389 domain-containing protein [Gammaproteobacteria bacterium]
MNSDDTGRRRTLRSRSLATLLARFSLKDDREENAQIDAELRAGVVMEGTNLWVLMFAILIASIGLNVNSTAVVIGAMLISPLMGPVLGVGYGVGVVDLALIRKALKNLGIATLIALLTSTLYFLATPLRSAQSELLARTAPTIWDVLIAFFGGLAGIIGVTRRQKSTVIPGVAIATALMPPLCTAGFGLANGAWKYFFGAFYLFTINCVFIAAAAALVIGAFRLPRHHFVDRRAERRVQVFLGAVVLITLIPSLYLAYELVGEEVFRTRAAQFVHTQLEFARTHVENVRVDPQERRIQVSLIGDIVPKRTIADVVSRMPENGLRDADLQVFQTGDQRIDVATLKSSLLGDLYRQSQSSLQDSERTVAQLRSQLAAIKANAEELNQIPAELHALYPQFDDILVSQARDWSADGGFDPQTTVIVSVSSSKPIDDESRTAIEQWLRLRAKVEHVRLVLQAGATRKR